MMTDETDKAPGAGRDIRQDRLKSALRENLKRRKLQARERAALTEPAQDDPDTSRRITGKDAD